MVNFKVKFVVSIYKINCLRFNTDNGCIEGLFLFYSYSFGFKTIFVRIYVGDIILTAYHIVLLYFIHKYSTYKIECTHSHKHTTFIFIHTECIKGFCRHE